MESFAPLRDPADDERGKGRHQQAILDPEAAYIKRLGVCLVSSDQFAR